MNNKNRPLSPHIQIYKPQISSITSILHRITGAALYFGMVLICVLIPYYTYQVNFFSGDEYQCECVILKALLYVIATCWAFALYYHLCNGIRHLFWDVGKGFELKTSQRNGILVLVISALMTALSVAYVLLFK